MQAQDGGGCIINIGSLNGLHPSPGVAAYGAAKAGLLNLTQSLAAEWAPKVRVNAVTAGIIGTDEIFEVHYANDPDRLGPPAGAGADGTVLDTRRRGRRVPLPRVAARRAGHRHQHLVHGAATRPTRSPERPLSRSTGRPRPRAQPYARPMGQNQRSQIVMSDEEIATFLEQSRTATMVTIGPNGMPHVVAMWYGLIDGNDLLRDQGQVAEGAEPPARPAHRRGGRGRATPTTSCAACRSRATPC